MHFKNLHLVAVLLCLASVARAQEEFTGTLGVQEDSSQTGGFTDSSLTLDISNITQYGYATEDFQGTVPYGTEVTAYSATINGLSSGLSSLSISNFLQIGTAGAFGSPGTTPLNRFDFNLQSLEESDPTNGQFIGYGTLVDTTGGYSDTPAELELSFNQSEPNFYSFTLEALPEPAAFTLLLAGIGVLPFLRRKF